MARTNFGPGRRARFVAALLFAAAPFWAAPASADPTDDAFIAALVGQGIPVPDGNAAVQEGRKMCGLLDQGFRRAPILMALMRDTNLSARQAGFFLGVSTSAYCPQYKSITG
jgi:hypothetical protein